jgi:hypothetical protein
MPLQKEEFETIERLSKEENNKTITQKLHVIQ